MLDNPNEEAFVLKWHETGNKSKAYRYAYPSSVNWKDETVHPKACTLSKKPRLRQGLKSYKSKQAQIMALPLIR